MRYDELESLMNNSGLKEKIEEAINGAINKKDIVPLTKEQERIIDAVIGSISDARLKENKTLPGDIFHCYEGIKEYKYFVNLLVQDSLELLGRLESNRVEMKDAIVTRYLVNAVSIGLYLGVKFEQLKIQEEQPKNESEDVKH